MTVNDFITGHDVSTFVSAPSIGFVNPFTGEVEEWHGQHDAMMRVLLSAAERINALEAELGRVKSYLVMD